MRRNEFKVENHEAMLELLRSCEYGTLSLLDNNKPYGVPLNFAWWEEGIVFHGSKEGKKAELIAKNSQASFSAVKPYSLIPSYFSHTTSACPATQLFASATLEGNISILEDIEQKANALNTIMQKLQPECHYETISPNNPIYTKMLELTAVFYLKVSKSSLKVKMGQNRTNEQKNILIEELKKRGNSLDLETIELIKAYM